MHEKFLARVWLKVWQVSYSTLFLVLRRQCANNCRAFGIFFKKKKTTIQWLSFLIILAQNIQFIFIYKKNIRLQCVIWADSCIKTIPCGGAWNGGVSLVLLVINSTTFQKFVNQANSEATQANATAADFQANLPCDGVTLTNQSTAQTGACLADIC